MPRRLREYITRRGLNLILRQLIFEQLTNGLDRQSEDGPAT